MPRVSEEYYENKRREMRPEDSGKIRKEESLEVLKNGPRETMILWLGDKLSNIRSIQRDFVELGDEVWQRSNQKDPAEHASRRLPELRSL